MKKIELSAIIILLVLVGWMGWKLQKMESIPEEVQNSENSLSMSVSFIHENDGFYNIQVEYPQFASVDSAFNKKISDLVLGKIETFKKDSRENYDARKATSLPGNPLPETPDQPFDFIAAWEPIQANSNYLSFVIRLYYFVGGAHGATEVYAFNYDLNKGKEITILDFLNSSQPALEKLSELSQKDVTYQLEATGVIMNNSLEQMVKEGTNPSEENFKNFNFSYNSITIYFQQYQVAPGAVGPVTVTFYKDTLDSNSVESDYLK